MPFAGNGDRMPHSLKHLCRKLLIYRIIFGKKYGEPSFALPNGMAGNEGRPGLARRRSSRP